MSIGRNISIFIFLFFCSSLLITSVLLADNEPIWLFTNDYHATTGGVAFNCYPSGYSNGWWWGYMAGEHEYSSHETLSGEWAAAIYYSGIQNNKVNWLTDSFIYPPWRTNTCFSSEQKFSKIQFTKPV